jgi:hypothetical protein
MISRLITSVFLISLGIFLTILGFVFSFIFLVYSFPVLIIGLFILFNKEDKIENIREVKKR